MKPVHRIPGTAMLCIVCCSWLVCSALYSQTRQYRAEEFRLDDNDGETIRLTAPHPMPGGASYSLVLPPSLPVSDFVLRGNSAGELSALDPGAAFNDVSWLISGNSSTNPASDFLGTSDSVDLVLRTNNIEQVRLTARGDVGVGTSSPVAPLHLLRTFPDTVAVDPFFNEPLAFGLRSELYNPAVPFPGGIYVSAAHLNFIQGATDMSGTGAFVGSGSLVVNTNTGGGIGGLIGVVGQAVQADAGSVVAGRAMGVQGSVQLSDGTINDAVGVSGEVFVEGGSMNRATVFATEFDVSGTGVLTEAFGLYVRNPYVDVGATLTEFTGIEIEDLTYGTTRTAIRYRGSGANAPFILEGDGDVGIGDETPDARLDVENSDAVVSTLELTNANVDGTALEITAGRMVLSYASGASATIPGNVVVYAVNDGNPGTAPTVALPATGTNGQILYVHVEDADGATVGGIGRAAGDNLTYLYAAGGWQLFHVN